MKVAIAKVFRISKKELQKKCIELIVRKAESISGDSEVVRETLSECIGDDLACLYNADVSYGVYSQKEIDQFARDLSDEDIRLILKHLGGRVIYDSLDGDNTEEDIAEAFDDCYNETFVQFLK